MKKSIKIALFASIITGCAVSQVALGKCSQGSCSVKRAKNQVHQGSTQKDKVQVTERKMVFPQLISKKTTCKNGTCKRK